MVKRKFKVGDRVKVKKDTVTLNRRTVGKCGTVKELLTDNYCSVEFDEFVCGHDCNGFAKEGHGWNYAEDALDLVKHHNETIVIYRNENKVVALDKSTGEKAEAKCIRLMGEDVKPDNGVCEVKRKAKVGEYIKIVDAKPFLIPYENGEIFRVIGIGNEGCKGKNSVKICYVWHDEYVVLENYKPEKEPEKKDEICVGDTVKVTDTGKQYSLYDNTWSGLLGYEQNFVIGSYVKNEDEYKVLRIKKHDRLARTIALIQNPKTSQVFIINIKGLKKVER